MSTDSYPADLPAEFVALRSAAPDAAVVWVDAEAKATRSSGSRLKPSSTCSRSGLPR